MKKISVLLATLAIVLFVNESESQIFSGGVGVYGTSNAVVLNSFVQQTNFAFVTLPSRTLQLQGINTNESATAVYGAIFSNLGGLTNFTVLVTNQFTFPASNGWVQNATFTTNIPPFTFTVGITPIGQMMIYTNGFGSTVQGVGLGSVSNNVLFQ
jgi:hypothetical protein